MLMYPLAQRNVRGERTVNLVLHRVPTVPQDNMHLPLRRLPAAGVTKTRTVRSVGQHARIVRVGTSQTQKRPCAVLA